MSKKEYFGNSPLKDKLKTKLKIALTDDSVTTEKIKDYAVITKKLADASVTADKLAGNSVGNNNILDGAVTTEKLSDKSVTTPKLATQSVTSEKLVYGSVTNIHLASGSVSSKNIQDKNILVKAIADEVWDKLQDEYLRLDGENKMQAGLDMDNNVINNVTSINSVPQKVNDTRSKKNYIELYDENGGLSLATRDARLGAIIIHKCSMNSTGFWTSTGFKTTDQSSFGLLGNEGSVVTAMSDSDVDLCLAKVFG